MKSPRKLIAVKGLVMCKHSIWIGIAIILVGVVWADAAAQQTPLDLGNALVSPLPQPIIEKFQRIDRRFDPNFYKKYLDVGGIAVVSSGKVADEAFYEVRYLVSHVLSQRRDILDAMASRNTRLIIIGHEEEVSEIPEYYRADPVAAAQQNRRVRGYGGATLTSFGEENLLCLPRDRYRGESIMIHEFAHCIDGNLRRMDPNWRRDLAEVFEDARRRGLWDRTYAATNAAEYWAEGIQSYFDTNKTSRTGRPDGVHNHVGNREELKAYDPNLHDFIEKTIGRIEWRYTTYDKRHPKDPIGRVGPVPDPVRERLALAPFYQKYIAVNELPIVGSEQVSDHALKEAAWIIRHMMAGRDDLLKAMADNRVRLAVMAYYEYTTDVPEHSWLEPTRWDRRARGLGATRRAPAVSCGEENLLGFPGDPYWNENILIHEFAHTIHLMAMPTVDPTFDKRLRALYQSARERGLWAGTYAMSNHEEYWAEGVQCWFECNRPGDSRGQATTRDAFKAYDPELAALCEEVFGDNAWTYNKPQERDVSQRAHLAGWDPAGELPRFVWRTTTQTRSRTTPTTTNAATPASE